MTPRGARIVWMLFAVPIVAHGQLPMRLVEVLDVEQAAEHVTVTLQFNCSLRYLGHTPDREGTELRVRLKPAQDCGGGSGSETSELVPLIDGDGIVTAARLEQVLPGELALTLSWSKPESFVLAQGADTRGLRIRLLSHPKRGGRIVVMPSTDVLANYAINLESRLKPFDPLEIERAASLLHLPAFVSVVDLDGQKWHRLRVGPLDRRSVAEQTLRTAAGSYPRAWLAIADDAQTNDPGATASEPLPAVERAGSDPPLGPGEQRDLLARARKAMSSREHAQAIALLTKLQRQPEFPQRAEVQELLALSRERNGQVAHAKAEYEEYLRHYPDGPAVERVRLRLRILRAAADDARSGYADRRRSRGWYTTGGFAQLYRRDQVRLTAPGQQIESVSQNALFNDGSFIARRRGERFDFGARGSAGYIKDLLPQGPGDQLRVSTAWIELNDRVLGVAGRMGRQSRSSTGVLGTFDGLALSCEVQPSWVIETAAGFPVESSRMGPQADRRFTSLSLRYAPDFARWSASAFLATQQYDGLRDRQAVGGEVSWFTPDRSVVGLIDYDLEFNSLNAAVLIGTFLMPGRWTLAFDLERRNSPLLTTRNALIGQPVGSLAELSGVFSEPELLALARDRTAVLSIYGLSATRPVGERFTIALDVSAAQLGGTPASGGIEAQPGTGMEVAYQAQLLGGSLFRPGDLNILAVRFEKAAQGKVESLSLASRIPIHGSWRVGPRFRADLRRSDSQMFTTTQHVYVPSLRIDYQRDGKLLELEVGAELNGRTRDGVAEDNKRYFFGAGYRVSF